MINRTLVQERLALMSSYLKELERLSELPRNEFLADAVRVAAGESFLRRSLEAAFDIGRHILAKSGHVDVAGEYKSIAQGMTELGVVDERLGQTLVRMAGYRNRLVHMYAQVTDEELHHIITNHLGDVRGIIVQVRDYIDESSS
ncbi:MAG: DUF86 domain-containing protein [Bacillota bacterium]